jgi:flavin reductase (DIM6/NTAB) family NADH-FMN oxidoreductase RutF
VLDCRVAAAHDAGDYRIYVGEVQAAEVAAERERCSTATPDTDLSR